MATQIVILNGDSILIDNLHPIEWADKGKNWVDAWCPNTVHAVIWNNLQGQNEIQNKDASTGDMTDFGNLTAARYDLATVSNSTRGVSGGGAAPGVSNVLDYVTIASTGNAADFGDLTAVRRGLVGNSDSHGGLQH